MTACVASGPEGRIFCAVHAEKSLPCDASSVRAARQFVTAELSGAGFADAAHTACLLVSELITNAVLHAGTPIRVVVEGSDDSVRIAVHDGSERAIQRRRHSLESATGRGLLLVEQLSAEWGVDPVDRGKAVWFTLPLGADTTEPGEPDLDMFLAFDEALAEGG